MIRRALSILGFGLAYFIAAAVPIALTRFNGGVSLVWVATALLTIKLASSTTDRRFELGLVCAVASAFATGLFGVGWLAALPLAMINVGEALLTAAILRRVDQQPAETAKSFVWFLLVGCVVSPAISGLFGALTVSQSTGTGLVTNYRDWYLGRGLGMLIFAPATFHWIRGDVKRWFASAFRRGDFGDMAVFLGALATIAFAFSQQSLPLLFLPVLALIIFTIRAGHVGAAIGIMLLSAISCYFTAQGMGPIALVHATPTFITQFMQFYLGATALTLLPVATILDAQKRATGLISESEERYRILADNVTDVVVAMDLKGILTYISPSIRHYGRQTAEELIGKSAMDLIDPSFHDIMRETHVRMLKSQTNPVVVEYIGATNDGQRRWFETIGRARPDETGMAIGIVGTVRETTGRRHLENELSVAAQSDVLTGLPNRRAFFDVARSLEATQEAGCLALIDLDHFKRVSDCHGHAAGDKVLRLFAQIGEEAIRSTDTLARLGGEEFAIMLPGATIEQAQVICQRILDNFAKAKMTNGRTTFHVTASAGIALFDGTIDEVLQRADTALYKAKGDGRARLALAA